jgi:hypothetical protein
MQQVTCTHSTTCVTPGPGAAYTRVWYDSVQQAEVAAAAIWQPAGSTYSATQLYCKALASSI